MLRFNIWQLAMVSCFFLSCHASTYTYWIDQSCKGKTDWTTYVNEAFQSAKRGSERLNDDSDSDYHYVFQRIFNVDRNSANSITTPSMTDTPRNLVFSRLDSFQKDWSETADRLNSNVRLYCDNAARWTQSGNKIVDKDNAMRMDDSQHPCQVQGSKTLGVTAFKRLSISKKKPSQYDKREVIDLCDKLFQVSNPKIPLKLDAVPDTDDLTQLSKGIRVFDRLASQTILHEFLHTRPYRLEDVDPAYGWSKIIAKSAQDALKNADSYNTFALFALIADRPVAMNENNGKTVKPGGLTLPRPNGQSNPDPQDEADVQAGRFRLYDDLTGSVPHSKRRSLGNSWIGMSFAA